MTESITELHKSSTTEIFGAFMKRLISAFLFSLCVLFFITGYSAEVKDGGKKSATVSSKRDLEYSDWHFIQSDKALQRRLALERMDGDIGYVRAQFRVKSDEPVHCSASDCDGYVLRMSHPGPSPEYEEIVYHFDFAPGFTDKIYTMEQPLMIELKTWPNGSRRLFDKQRGIAITDAQGNYERFGFFFDCVDFRLKNDPKHRCSRDFDESKAVHVK